MRAPHHKPKIDPVHGLLLVDKPTRITSHDVVHTIRQHFNFRKVGHGGTLDPMATGLLPILIGRGTKLSEQIMDSDKTYEGTLHLGIHTDSHDIDGTVLEEKDPSAITTEDLAAAFAERTGDIMQVPPMFSAIKKNGTPLYKLARKGEQVERKARLIHVYEFSMLEGERLPKVRFRLRCSKGTYVRTLCAEIGEALGCGAHLCELRRTRTGAWSIEDAIGLEALTKGTLTDLEHRVIPIYKVREHATEHA